MMAGLCSSGSSVSPRKNSAAEIRASLGHEKNQSMEVFEKKTGKFLRLILSVLLAVNYHLKRQKSYFIKKFNEFVKSLTYFAIF